MNLVFQLIAVLSLVLVSKCYPISSGNGYVSLNPYYLTFYKSSKESFPDNKALNDNCMSLYGPERWSRRDQSRTRSEQDIISLFIDYCLPEGSCILAYQNYDYPNYSPCSGRHNKPIDKIFGGAFGSHKMKLQWTDYRFCSKKVIQESRRAHHCFNCK